MKIVIDSNRILAAMIKEGTTKEILFDPFFSFIAPSYILEEIKKYSGRVIEATQITENEFDVLLTFIFERIEVVAEKEYGSYLDKAKEIPTIKKIGLI